MTIYRLRKIYRLYSIKKKVIKSTKLPNLQEQNRITSLAEVFGRQVRFAHLDGFRIVQLDEMMVTKRTFPTHDWSAKYTNHQMDIGNTDTRAIAVVGAVSREKGVECLMTFKESINTSKFKVFLEELRNRNLFDNIILVMDNLAIHKSKIVTMRMEELRFRWAWSPPYSP